MTATLDRRPIRSAAWERVAGLAAGQLGAHGPDGTPSLGAATLARLRAASKGDGAAIRAWRDLARPEQLPPEGEEWLFWLLCAGRGFGKSWVGSHTLAEWATEDPGDYAAIGPTFGDARKIMTEGESGLLAALGDELREYNRGEFILYLRSGSRIILASADVPDRLRGLNLKGAWLDELGSMGASRDLWDLALLPALRKGARPRAVITTTPRRGSPVLVELLDRSAAGDPLVHVTRGSTMDNAENLSDAFIKSIYARYGDSALGAQELGGELLQDAEGALLTSELIERWRVRPDDVPDLSRVSVGVDPAGTAKDSSDETGIIVVGLGPAPEGWRPPSGQAAAQYLDDLPHLYVLQDATLKGSPDVWAQRALAVADTWDAEHIAAEVNMGHDLVAFTIRTVCRSRGLRPTPVREVRATRGKKLRAEPLIPLAEQGRVHFVGRHAKLEGEWTGWVSGETKKSPDRVDAHVWASVDLMPELGLKAPTEVRIIA